jgi:sortase (surface protein transpeptidase)
MLALKQKFYLVIIAGLGLGMGLSFALALFPTIIKAQEDHAYSYGVQIKRIKSPSLGIDTLVSRGKLDLLPIFKLEAPALHLNNSFGIGQGKAIFVQGIDASYSLNHLNQARVGDEVFVIGSNQGWYRYKILKVNQMPLGDLTKNLPEQETLVLFVLDPFSREVERLVALPNKLSN